MQNCGNRENKGAGVRGRIEIPDHKDRSPDVAAFSRACRDAPPDRPEIGLLRGP
jgi:hypothetical protein